MAAQGLGGHGRPGAVVTVDCTKTNPDSINAALGSAASPLTLEIRGICREDVVIERPHVTLRGADPSTDGVEAVAAAATDPLGAAVLIRGTHSVRLENLQLTGGARSGLALRGTGSDIFVTGCLVHGNGVNGIELREAFVELSGSEVSEVNDGINARNQATLRTFDTEVSAGNVALRIQGGSGAVVVRGSATGGSSLVLNEASATVFLTDLIGDLSAGDGSKGFLLALDLDGGFAVEGKSRLGLIGVTQTSAGGDNRVRQDSTLSLMPGVGSTTLVRNVAFTEFSNGDLGGTASLLSVSCDVSSNALCPGAALAGGSTCSFCP